MTSDSDAGPNDADKGWRGDGEDSRNPAPNTPATGVEEGAEASDLEKTSGGGAVTENENQSNQTDNESGVANRVQEPPQPVTAESGQTGGEAGSDQPRASDKEGGPTNYRARSDDNEIQPAGPPRGPSSVEHNTEGRTPDGQENRDTDGEMGNNTEVDVDFGDNGTPIVGGEENSRAGSGPSHEAAGGESPHSDPVGTLPNMYNPDIRVGQIGKAAYMAVVVAPPSPFCFCLTKKRSRPIRTVCLSRLNRYAPRA